MIKLTKILIEMIPLSQEEKCELFDKMKDNLVDETNQLLLELKFGIIIKLKIFNFLCFKFFLLILIMNNFCRFIS